MAATEESGADDMKHCYENLILIDVGANLTNKKYSRDLDAVVQRAQDSGQYKNFIDANFSDCYSQADLNSSKVNSFKPISKKNLIRNVEIVAMFVLNDNTKLDL